MTAAVKMGGPRVGAPDSKQDYATPPEFIAAVEKRFGPVTFDLAAHADNAKHARYFAPNEFVTTTGSKKTGDLVVTRTPNLDPNAVAFDSLDQDWTRLGDGLLWLNPEFGDIGPWAKKCANSTRDRRGATQIAMLVPAAVGANWFRDHVAPFADVYLLNDRICFDGKNVFPKDCLLAHFQGAPPMICLWGWKKDAIYSQWSVR